MKKRGYHLERKVGLYDVLTLKCSKKLTRHNVPKLIRKNILIICATISTLHIITNVNTTLTNFIIVALADYYLVLSPYLRNHFIVTGKILSYARAC